MSGHPIWTTTAVVALPEPWKVSLNVDGNTEVFPAPALLLQRDERTGHCRVVLGVLNPERGEIEAVDPDWDDDGRLGGFIQACQ